MARLPILSIAEALAEAPTDIEALFLCTSLDVGKAWLQELKQSYPELKVPRPVTVLEFIAELAQPGLKQHRLSLISPVQQEALINELWNQLEPTFDAKSKAQLGIGSSLVQGLRATIQELRMAGVEAVDWMIDAFPARGKGAILQTLLSNYEASLQERKWADPARLCLLARDRLLAEDELAGQVLLMPAELVCPGLLQSVLDQVPTNQRFTFSNSIATKLTLFESTYTDAGRLAWLRQPQDAPPVRRDDTIKLYRALSPEYEVLALFGTLLQKQIPFGDAEVLYSEESLYPELFYSIASSRQPDASRRVPISFRGGIPLRWTGPGKAFLFLQAWVAAGYSSLAFAEWLIQDLLNLPTQSSRHMMLTVLRQLPPATGLSGWQQQCQRFITDQHDKALKVACQALLQLVEALIEMVPSSDAEPNATWHAIDLFLKGHAGSKNDWDRQCIAQTRSMIRDYRTAEGMTSPAIWERVRTWMLEGSLPPEPMQPGQLALTPLSRLESLRRPHTFMVGLSEDLYPTMPRRESLLTDRERKGLSPEMMQQSTRELMHRQELSLVSILEQLPGNVTILYPCADQLDDRERFPSQLFLRVFRLAAELPEGDLHELESWLEAPLGPDSPLCRLTSTEAWLNHWPEQPYVDPLFKVDFPLLCRGAYAAKQRQSYQFTEHDGHVTAAGAQFDPARSQHPYSAHSLQRYGRCPLQFFYHDVLHLKKPQEHEVEPGRWLPALVRGEILHALFHQYHVQLLKEKRLPDRLNDGPLLRELLAALLEARKAELPEVASHVRDVEMSELHETLHIFLTEEAQWSESHQPRYFEAALGMESEGSVSEIDTAEPISIRLPSGRSILLRGRVDRIDALFSASEEAGVGPQYFIWDYKTGRMKEFQSPHARRTGRLLQPLLYLEMVEKRLREVVDPTARVAGAGYFFPGQRGGQGDRLSWTSDELRHDSNVLDIILDLLQHGIFLATDQADACRHCEFQDACDLSEVNRQAVKKQQHGQNTALLSLRKLRSAP